jgi:hypothetical protein
MQGLSPDFYRTAIPPFAQVLGFTLYALRGGIIRRLSRRILGWRRYNSFLLGMLLFLWGSSHFLFLIVTHSGLLKD